MLLAYLLEEAYEQLLHNVAANSGKYADTDEWLGDYFAGKDFFKKSSIDVKKFHLSYEEGMKSDEQKSQEDLVNVRNMYGAFMGLSPLQAGNKYMWTYLCHAEKEYHKYIVNRWLTEARDNTIKTRFFVTGARSLYDNALSRLWWYGYLTYDGTNKANPYALTEVLLTNQTICTDFIDTKNSINPNRAKGVLSALKEFKEQLKDNEGITEYFRAVNKYLNRYAAVTILDFLEPEEIKKITLDYLNEYRGNQLKNKQMGKRVK